MNQQGNGAMGRFSVEMEVANYLDVAKAAEGTLPPEKVRPDDAHGCRGYRGDSAGLTYGGGEATRPPVRRRRRPFATPTTGRPPSSVLPRLK